MRTLTDLLGDHIASSLAKQQALSDLLGDHDWSLDMAQGMVDFGQGWLFPVQILGTESEEAGTWLWSWANTVSDIPQHVTQAAADLRALGHKENIAEFVQARLSLDDASGHLLSLIASGLCHADCYYRGPYSGGAVYFLISFPASLRENRPLSLDQIVSTITAVAAQFDVDHPRMIESFLIQQKFIVEWDGALLQGRSQDGGAVIVTFDEINRISNINTALGYRLR